MLVSRLHIVAVAAFVLCLLALFPVGKSAAALFETKAGQAFVVDAETGAVLLDKDADKPVPPASLAKLMTMELVFRALKSGELSPETTFKVSEHAWRTGGAPSGTSTMFAELKSEIRVADLIRAVIVQSANDGCIILAEGMAGSEAAFAERMTARARELGLEVSTFRNSTGLPAEGQVVTMRELVRLARHIWREYPDHYRIYSQLDFTWNGIFQRNRNPLLRMEIGADGMKTGYTEESGYAIVASAARGGRRVFAAMSGLESEAVRAEEARRVLDWAMNDFRHVELFGKGAPVGEAVIFGGARPSVKLRADGPVIVPAPSDAPDAVQARIVYEGPLVAPLEEGAPVGRLEVRIDGTVSIQRPLYAAETVERGALTTRAYDGAVELLTGWMR